jgi:hydroxylamine reductase
MKIEKDMIIGDILDLAPEKVNILLEAGMHCLSCPAALMETLEEACEVHGIDVNDILEELNKETTIESK